VATWLSVEEVCAELGVGRSTFADWRVKGTAPRCKRMPNGRVIVRRDWLDEWFEQLPEAGVAA
jgi:predicted DNA-binding transcriptional regulator AlpA